MSKWSDGYVTTNGQRLHYYRTGGNKPQVVFNHGAGDDGLCWTHIIKQLEAEYDIIMPDARGHGKSATGKKDYSSAQRVEDLKGLIQALKLDRPIIGGHSMGADTSMRLAAKYPELTRGVFLEDPPIVLPGETMGSPDQTMKSEDMGKMMRRFMLIFKLMPRFIGVRMARKMSPAYPDDEINPWVDSKRRVSFEFLNAMNAMADMLSADPFEAIKQIQVPVILFIGDKEKMSIVSSEGAQKAAEANAKLRVVHLEGASHDIRRTRFDGYMPALKDFLKEIYC
jgi:pimeloyl-ACP methyl ester carboxylesterase